MAADLVAATFSAGKPAPLDAADLRVGATTGSRGEPDTEAGDANRMLSEGPSSDDQQLALDQSLPPAMRVVANLESLRRYNPGRDLQPVAVWVCGHRQPNDGGGGIFLWDPSSARIDDNGATIKPLRADRPGRFLRSFAGPRDVKWWGARGDSEHDDVAAIQAAIDYGPGAVVLPNGTYRCTQAIRVPGRINMLGESRGEREGGGVRLRFVGACNGLEGAAPWSQVEIGRFTIDVTGLEPTSGDYIGIYQPFGMRRARLHDITILGKRNVVKFGVLALAVHPQQGPFGIDDTPEVQALYYNSFLDLDIRITEQPGNDGYPARDSVGMYLGGSVLANQKANLNYVRNVHVRGFNIAFALDEGHSNLFVNTKSHGGKTPYEDHVVDYHIRLRNGVQWDGSTWRESGLPARSRRHTHDNVFLSHSFDNASALSNLVLLYNDAPQKLAPQMAHFFGCRNFDPTKDVSSLSADELDPPSFSAFGNRQNLVGGAAPRAGAFPFARKLAGGAEDGWLVLQGGPSEDSSTIALGGGTKAKPDASDTGPKGISVVLPATADAHFQVSRHPGNRSDSLLLDLTPKGVLKVRHGISSPLVAMGSPRDIEVEGSHIAAVGSFLRLAAAPTWSDAITDIRSASPGTWLVLSAKGGGAAIRIEPGGNLLLHRDRPCRLHHMADNLVLMSTDDGRWIEITRSTHPQEQSGP